MALEGISTEQLKREGVAAETIRFALIPILEREFERSLNALDVAETWEKTCAARAEIKVIRQIMKNLDSKYRLTKE
jgi:hypothetical protein